MTNGGKLAVYAAATEAEGDYGALITVSNTLAIHAGSRLYPHSHNSNGGSPRFELRRLLIAAGGALFAEARGFSFGQGPGKGILVSDRGGGGAYGGGGGRSEKVNGVGGAPYGVAECPLSPGSGSGVYNTLGAPGGGLIWVEATESVVNDGEIRADGGEVHTHSGGGAGGGIYLRTPLLAGTGSITADGGAGSARSGGGGGGRIAIHAIRDRLTGEQAGSYSEYAGAANGRVSVAGATGYAAGTNGTFHLWRPQHTVIVIQ